MSREWHVELGTRETFGMFAKLRVPDSESELRCRDELGRRRRSRALNDIVKLLLYRLYVPREREGERGVEKKREKKRDV